MMKSAQSKTTTLRRHSSQRTATDSQARASRLAQRVGFTLVELLMVIVIIGILVSMLAVAINPVLQTARETTVTVEMKQLELAIESFKTKYGFYPPSFQGFNQTATGTGAQLLPYLNKISPNHQEGSGAPGTRLSVWWNTYGNQLTDSGSLIFWLNGLSKNKQFPLTGGLPNVDAAGNAVATGGNFQLPVIFNADLAISVDAAGAVQPVNGQNEFDLVGAFERESLFDFRGGQLSDQFFNYGLMPPALAATAPGIRVYNVAHGNGKFDLAYRYRNSAFYDLPDPDPTNPSLPVNGRGADAFYVSVVNPDGTADQVFLNPNTFQISTLGLDGRVSTFASTAINKPSTGDANQRKSWQEFNGDNIVNFANGRLDGFDWDEAVELGGKEPK